MRAELRRLLMADLGASAPAYGFCALILFAAVASGVTVAVWTIAMLILNPISAHFLNSATVGNYRARSILPLSQAELGRARWWFAIGFPGLALMLACLLAGLVQMAFLRSGAHFTEIGAIVLWVWAGLGLFTAVSLWLGRKGVTVLALAAMLVLLLQSILWHPSAEQVIAVDFSSVVAAGFVVIIYFYVRSAQLMRPPLRPEDGKEFFGFLRRVAPRGPSAAGWAALLWPLAWRLLALVLVIATVATVFLLGFRLSLAARAMPVDLEAMLLMLAFSGTFVGERVFVMPLMSGLRVLQALPLSAEALAARLLAVALAPAGAVLLTILIAHYLLAAPQTSVAALLFVPILLLMFSTQAFWAAALARRNYAFLPMIALTLPMPVLPFATKLLRISVPSWVLEALSLATPLCIALALAIITAAYFRTCRELRAQRGRRPATLLKVA